MWISRSVFEQLAKRVCALESEVEYLKREAYFTVYDEESAAFKAAQTSWCSPQPKPYVVSLRRVVERLMSRGNMRVEFKRGVESRAEIVE